MVRLKFQQYRVFIVSAILWLAIDLGVKYYVSNTNINSVVFIKKFFYLSLQTNKGVAFGIHLGYVFQLIVSVIIVSLLLYFGFQYILPIKKHTFINQFLLGIIIGGAAGNLINRFTLGYVIDYIVLKPLPVFNIADIGITIGLIALFLLTYNTNNKEI
jgi:signal peptidase II